MQQLLLDLLPPPRPSLANFVIGSNGAALAALRAWQTEAEVPPCLLFWGEPGSGRSHLLAASGADCVDARHDGDLAGVPDAFPAQFRLAVDNVETLSAAGQIALFNAFNRLRASGGRLLASAPLPPQQLLLREDLRTRLGGGLIYRLQPLTDAEKARALRERAGSRALNLSDEAIDTLFRYARRDMGSLVALVDALDRFTLEHRRPVTLPLLRQLLAEHTQPGLPV